MKRILLFSLLLFLGWSLKAQKVDSLFFHLYTDSLKKGTHNYINVDGKLSNGQWLPLTAKDLDFTSSAYSFAGNELILPFDCKEDKVTVKAVLKKDPTLWIEKTIWVKQKPDPEFLPTKEDVMKPSSPSKKRR